MVNKKGHQWHDKTNSDIRVSIEISVESRRQIKVYQENTYTLVNGLSQYFLIFVEWLGMIDWLKVFIKVLVCLMWIKEFGCYLFLDLWDETEVFLEKEFFY